METLVLMYNSLSNSEEMAKDINKFRLSNKNNWYQVAFENETTGERKYLKCFNTWVQITRIPEISTVMDLKPKEFLSNIQRGINSLIRNY